MTTNRSLPADILLPHISYPNLLEAVAWLSEAFGFREYYRYGEPARGVMVHLGRAYLMLRNEPEQASPAELGYGTQSLTIFVEDVDAHYARAKAAGAAILEEPHETIYGEWQYAAADLAGHHWVFSRHARDRNPADWGAKVAE